MAPLVGLEGTMG